MSGADDMHLQLACGRRRVDALGQTHQGSTERLQFVELRDQSDRESCEAALRTQVDSALVGAPPINNEMNGAPESSTRTPRARRERGP